MAKIEVDCHACQGTGIGMHGDPNTSKCTVCHGKGYVMGYENEDEDEEHEEILEEDEDE